jgi:hypothetical protein
MVYYILHGQDCINFTTNRRLVVHSWCNFINTPTRNGGGVYTQSSTILRPTKEKSERSVDFDRFPQGRSSIVQGWDQRSATGVQRRETVYIDINIRCYT